MSENAENQVAATEQTGDTAQAAPETINGRKIIGRTGPVTVVENIFKFRKVTDKETKVETQRPAITLHVPVPSMEGIIDILENGDSRPKELELLLAAIHDVVIGSIKDALSEDGNLTAENFPLAKYTFAEIANAPESERGGRGLDKELLAAFLVDYIEVMPAASGKDVKVVEKQAAVMQQRFNPIRNHAQKNQILTGFKSALDTYVGATKNLEDFAPVVEVLQKRIEDLSKQEINMTDALGF